MLPPKPDYPAAEMAWLADAIRQAGAYVRFTRERISHELDKLRGQIPDHCRDIVKV